MSMSMSMSETMSLSGTPYLKLMLWLELSVVKQAMVLVRIVCAAIIQLCGVVGE